MHSALSETTVRKVALYVGLAALAAGMAMAFEYGRAMSLLHAVSLGLLAITVSIAFVGAEIYRSSGRHTAAMIATIAGVAFSIGEYGSHFGYSVGARVADTQQTTVQNATYSAAQKNRDSEVANLDMWKKQLASLLEANGWAATVKAEGLRAQVAAIDKDIELETAKGGCKGKCLQKMNAKGKLEERVATIEQAADLSKRIEATQRILDRKVETAAKTDYHSSKIVNQTFAFAQLATWSDEPSDSARSWTQLALGAVIAAITTYLAPFCFSLAFSGRSKQDEPGIVTPAKGGTSYPAASVAPRTAAPIVLHETKIERHTDEGAKRLKDLLAMACGESAKRLSVA